MQVELLVELVGKLCCAFPSLVAYWALEIEFLLDASTLGGSKAIAAAVMSQTSMNLGDSNVIVKNRNKTSRKAEEDAFARILARKLDPASHPFGRFNKATQYDPILFQPGRVYVQIWFSPKHESANY